MKGVVFNLLESFICEKWGHEKYEEILEMCPLKTREPFVSPGTYPDADLMTIATKTADNLGLSLEDALRAFGHYCFPRLADRVPSLIEGLTDARSFLLSVDSVIHVEVRKLFPEAVTPKFIYEQPAADQLIIHYQSERKLCAFMEGLIDGVAKHFNTRIDYHQSACMHHGADECEFHLTFSTLIEGAAS